MPNLERRRLYGLLIPWGLLLVIGSSFEPPAFRPFELLLQGHSHFLPNRVVEMDAYGALAYVHHTPEYRHVRKNRFSTDAAGFRNPPFAAAPRIVLLGDSFVVGVGLSDEETLSFQLSGLLNEPVYNYGAQGNEAIPLFLSDRRFVRNPPRVAVFMPSQSAISPIVMPKRVDAYVPITQTQPSHVRVWLDTWTRPIYSIHGKITDFLLVVERDNGLKRWTQESYSRAHRAVFGFPNLIEVEGKPALVQTIQAQLLDKTPEERKLDAIVASLQEVRDALARRGTQLLIAPIPETGDVYLDLVPADQQAAVQKPLFLDVFLDRLRQEGFRTYDVRPDLRARRSPYLFLRDDTHWNERGVRLTAEALLPVVTSTAG
jgi:hypothetical protein